MSETSGKQSGSGERRLRQELRFTLRQLFMQKGWDFICRIEEHKCVAEVRCGSNILIVRGGIFGEAIEYVEDAFVNAVSGAEIAKCTTSDYGLTNSYIVRESGENTFEGARFWAEQVAAEQQDDMGVGGVISFDYQGGDIKTVSFLHVVSTPGYKGRVQATNAAEAIYLESQGYENQGDYHSNVEEEDVCDLASILDCLALRFSEAPEISPKAVKKTTTACTAASVELTPLAVLNLDLNSLGAGLADFRLDGGYFKSNRAARIIPSWFPKGRVTPEEMCAHLTLEIEKRGHLAVGGYRSARGLALGLMGSRHGQIKIISENEVVFNELTNQ